MSDNSKPFSILLLEDDPAEQLIFMHAINEVKGETEVEIVYSGQQLGEFFLKDKLYRDLNRQRIPEVVFINATVKEFDPAIIERIRIHDQFRNLPIFLFSDENNFITASGRAIFSGVTKWFKKPATC